MNTQIVVANDGFEEPDAENPLHGGTFIKFIDGRWKDRDGLTPPPKLLLMSINTMIQRWKDQKPIETILKKPGEPFPDVETLNEGVPQTEWEPGLGDQLRPPYQLNKAVSLLDPATAKKYIFSSGTVGTHIAVRNISDCVRSMRMLRGENVVPVVKLDSRAMKTKFGEKQRPEFSILGWVALGADTQRETAALQIEHQPAEEESPARARATRSAFAPKKMAGMKAVEPVTLAEEMDDSIDHLYR